MFCDFCQWDAFDIFDFSVKLTLVNTCLVHNSGFKDLIKWRGKSVTKVDFKQRIINGGRTGVQESWH